MKMLSGIIHFPHNFPHSQRYASFRRICISQAAVVPRKPTILIRDFHNKSSFALQVRDGTKSKDTASPRLRQGNANSYFMLTSSMPSITKPEDILTSLASLIDQSQSRPKAKENPAIVILATPSFATWLENTSFVSRILGTTFNSTQINGKSGLNVSALLAVVDGLPRPKSPEPADAGTRSTEGFAFLECDHHVTLPDLWETDRIGDHKASHQHQRSSLVISILPPTERSSDVNEVCVPLANTIFRNGRPSTLLVSRWERENSLNSFQKTQQIEKNSIVIHPSLNASIESMRIEVPAIPLTPPRRVVSGLGNIIKQVVGAEDKPVSASQELEASVDAYFTESQLDKQAIAVWALIVPNALMEDMQRQSAVENDSITIAAAWRREPRPDRDLWIGRCLTAGAGASVHRVLSGGGGWGPKQGLLSLDPETVFAKSADARYDFDSSDSMESDRVQALGNIAKPGTWIQFFTSRELTPEETATGGGHFQNSNTGRKPARILAFGCIPSTVDDIPQAQPDVSRTNGDDVHPIIEAYAGRFGAQSEAGIFLRLSGAKGEMGTKMDVPYSIFSWPVTEGDNRT